MKKIVLVFLMVLVFTCGCSESQIKDEIVNIGVKVNENGRIRELNDSVIVSGDIKSKFNYEVVFNFKNEKVSDYILKLDFNSRRVARALYESYEKNFNSHNIKLNDTKITLSDDEMFDRYKEYNKEELVDAFKKLGYKVS